MPQQIWGYDVGDEVEVVLNTRTHQRPFQWEHGRVLAFTDDRCILVALQKPHDNTQTVKVLGPQYIRRWVLPSSLGGIEDYLNG